MSWHAGQAAKIEVSVTSTTDDLSAITGATLWIQHPDGTTTSVPCTLVGVASATAVTVITPPITPADGQTGMWRWFCVFSDQTESERMSAKVFDRFERT